MKAIRLVSIIVVLAVLVVSTAPVYADRPTKWTDTWSGTQEYSCGTFSIYDDFIVNASYQDFYDNQGNLIRGRGLLRATDRFYNPVSGKEVFGRVNQVVSMDFVDGHVRNLGLAYHVVLPGVGTILIDAGYLSAYPPYDPTSYVLHGNHQYWDGDFGKLCSALE